MFRLEHNVETGEVKEIAHTEEEIKQILKEQADFLARRKARLAEIAAEEKAKSELKKPLLEKLGITEEEAKLLLS